MDRDGGAGVQVDPVAVGTWLAVGSGIVLVSVIGWAVSSLHVLAGWTDNATRAEKLEICKGILASISAGGIGAVYGVHAGWPMVAVILAAFFGGYSGDRWLKPLAEAVLARVNIAITGATPPSGSRPPAESRPRDGGGG